MSKIKMAIIFVFATIIQTSIINIFDVFGIVPNLILCLVCVIAFLYDNGWKSIGFGMVSLLLIDVVTLSRIGISSLFILLIGAFVYYVRQKISLESIISPIFLGITGTILFDAITYLTNRLLGSQYTVIYFLKFEIIEIILNVILMTILYLIMVRNAVRENRLGKIYEEDF
ncbi:MAG: rod shape-determining protein MreD [Anaerovoracaceae bacterium]